MGSGGTAISPGWIVIQLGRILIARTDAFRTRHSAVRFTLARSMRQGEFGGAADVFLADLGRRSPSRHGAGGLDDG